MAMHMMFAGKPHVVPEAGNQEAMDDEESMGQCVWEWEVSMSTSVKVVLPLTRSVMTSGHRPLSMAVDCSYQRTEKSLKATAVIL